MKFSFKNLFSKKKSARVHAFRLVYPEREWFGGLLLAFLVFGGCAAYASFTFLASTERVDVGVVGESASHGVVYDREGVGRVLKEYSARAERFNTLRKDAPAPPPPPVATTSAATTKTEQEKATSTPELQSGELKVE